MAFAAGLLALFPGLAVGGSLDVSFGHRGRVVDFYSDDDFGPISGLVRQPDGHLVVLGSEDSGPLHAWRYTRLGRRVGVRNERPKALSAGNTEPASALALSDGRVVMTGTWTDQQGSGGLGLARLNANLTDDARFGSSGLVAFPATFPLIDGRAIAADGDKLVVGGLARVGDELLFGVARFNGDGSLDETFGSRGLVTFAAPGSEDRVSFYSHPDQDFRAGLTSVDGVQVQPDHRILVAGSVRDRASGGPRVAAARLLPAGSLDPSYGDAGSGTTVFSFGQESCGRACRRPARSDASAAILQGGKLVIAGSAGPPFDFFESAQFAVARMTSDGHLDSTFGQGGVARADFGGSTGGAGLVAQPDGSLVVGGGTDTTFALARFRPDGRLDTRYGTLGRACDERPTNDLTGAGASALVAEPDGRVVAAGGTKDAGTSLVVTARFARRYKAAMSCVNVTPYVLPRNTRRFSGVIAHASHIKIRVSRDSADGNHPAKKIGFVDLGWHRAGAFSIPWNLRVHGHRLRRGQTYSVRLYATDRHGHTLQRDTTGVDLSV